MDNKNNDIYTYYFVDDTKYEINFKTGKISRRWLKELEELDRKEYNINHAETRRHCSLNAIDPRNLGGPFKDSKAEAALENVIVKEFMGKLPLGLQQIAGMLYMGYTQAEISRLMNTPHATISYRVKLIVGYLEKYMKE